MLNANQLEVLKVLALRTNRHRKLTVGELTKHVRISKSTVRRSVFLFKELGLLDYEFVDYKSTGKRVFSISDEGRTILSDYQEMFK